MTRHIDLPGLRWKRIEPEPTDDPGVSPFRTSYDLFGDGSLVLLPTPGHTPGSMSLLVRRPGQPPLVMVGDLTYDVHLLESGRVPGVGGRRRLRSASALINQLAPGAPGSGGPAGPRPRGGVTAGAGHRPRRRHPERLTEPGPVLVNIDDGTTDNPLYGE